MKIYLDLLLIQNIVLMFLILSLFNKVFNLKVKMIRILIISIITNSILISVLSINAKLYNSLLINFILSILVIKYGMKVEMKNEILLKTSVLWIITILIGGANVFSSGNIVYTLLVFLVLSFVIIKLESRKRNRLYLEYATCFIEFEYEGNRYNFKSLVDTGHSVKTVYDEDVIFVKDNLLKIKGGDKWKKRKVSYKTVSGINENYGIKIYNINISYGNRKIQNNAVIVSTPNISERFDAIVSLNFVEGGCTYGNINFNERESEKIFS